MIVEYIFFWYHRFYNIVVRRHTRQFNLSLSGDLTNAFKVKRVRSKTKYSQCNVLRQKKKKKAFFLKLEFVSVLHLLNRLPTITIMA